MKSSPSDHRSWLDSVKRFLLGLAFGLFFAVILWSFSAFFHVSISLVQGIAGSLVLAISCGVAATAGNLDRLLDALPPL